MSKRKPAAAAKKAAPAKKAPAPVRRKPTTRATRSSVVTAAPALDDPNNPAHAPTGGDVLASRVTEGEG